LFQSPITIALKGTSGNYTSAAMVGNNVSWASKIKKGNPRGENNEKAV